MIKAEIEDMKKKLNHLIDSGLDSKSVYDLSVQLDRLIVRYYREKEGRH